MTRGEALSLLGEYCEVIASGPMPTLNRLQADVYIGASGMRARFPADGSTSKAMRWLGYMQGVLEATGVYTLDEVKEHSRRKRVGL